jgi:drug/metabolite transporter (DMT)-like permease
LTTGFGLFLALFSAVTSASFHAMLKTGEDRLALRVWNCMICAALALPVALWTGPLPMSLWPTMAGFAVLSATNIIILNHSYKINDFSAAYPVARGIVPLVMAMLGVWVLGDHLGTAAMLGIAAITMGIITMAFGKSMSAQGWLAAILTGLTTIGYNLFTAKGMREAADPLNFIAWLFVADCILIPLYLVMQTKGGTPARLRQSFRYSWPSGFVTLASFSALAYAFRYAPVGMVSAIRESSVLIGLVLAAFMMKERLDLWRIAAGLLIVAGATMLALG